MAVALCEFISGSRWPKCFSSIATHLSQEKTKITPVSEGFDFLGFHIRKLNGKLKVTPSKSSIKGFKSKVKRQVQHSGHLAQEALISNLNAVIRGWANYYRYGNSSRVYSDLDHYLWKLTWQWAKRRHPKKGLKWVKKKYFKTSWRSNWDFRGKTRKGKPLSLLKCSHTQLGYHTKIRGDSNPYDPQDVVYFTQRHQKSKGSIQSRTLQKLWTKQSGSCPICREPITIRSGWHTHHIKRRCDGGKTETTNLILLHPVCHEQWHARDYARWAGLPRGDLKRA